MAAATHSRTERAIELFHALSDETRLEIIELLRKGERCVCDLTDTLDAAQSRLSFHLRVLKEAGQKIDSLCTREAVFAADLERTLEAAIMRAIWTDEVREACAQRLQLTKSAQLTK